MSAPFSNCRFRECDLPGQCRDEGKCHHPAVAAANLAEPVVWYGGNNYCTTNREIAERFHLRPAYAAPVEPIWCQSCGDSITAHDPGVCGNCFAMKYRDASTEIFDRQRAGFDRCFEALGITDDRERDWSGLVLAINEVVEMVRRIPTTPAEMIAFIGPHFNGMTADAWDESKFPAAPAGDLSRVEYSVSVHDLLSAFDWADLGKETIAAAITAKETP